MHGRLQKFQEYCSTKLAHAAQQSKQCDRPRVRASREKKNTRTPLPQQDWLHPTFSSNYKQYRTESRVSRFASRSVGTVRSCSSTHVTEYSRDGNIDNPRGSRRDATQERREKKRKKNASRLCVALGPRMPIYLSPNYLPTTVVLNK